MYEVYDQELKYNFGLRELGALYWLLRIQEQPVRDESEDQYTIF